MGEHVCMCIYLSYICKYGFDQHMCTNTLAHILCMRILEFCLGYHNTTSQTVLKDLLRIRLGGSHRFNAFNQSLILTRTKTKVIRPYTSLIPWEIPDPSSAGPRPSSRRGQMVAAPPLRTKLRIFCIGACKTIFGDYEG